MNSRGEDAAGGRNWAEFGTPLADADAKLRDVDFALIADLVRELRLIYAGRLQAVKLVGSRARGDARPTSDYDFLVLLDTCDYAIELPRLEELSAALDGRHHLGALSLSPMSREQFIGLDSKYPGITDSFRRDALKLWP